MDLVEEYELYCVPEIEGRVTELLLIGLEEWLLCDCATESLEELVLETDLAVDLLFEAARVG